MRSSVLAAFIVLSSCASPAPPDAASAPAAGSAGTEPAAAPDPAEGACLAAMDKLPPHAATEKVGTITFHPGKDACSFEVRDKGGAVRTAPPCDPKHGRESVLRAGCAVGGDAIWPADPNVSEKAETVELVVGRYTHPDAKADLALICTPFAELEYKDTGKTIESQVSGLDDSQRARLRAAVLEEKMTSRAWRLWLHDFPDHREASIAKLRDAAKAAGLSCQIEWTKK